MNCTKESSTVIPKVFSLVAMLVISIICSCILYDQLNFMVVSSAISIPASDFSVERKHSSTNFRYFFALSVCVMVLLILLAIVIRMNMRLNLLDRSHALWYDFSSSLLVFVRAVGLSSNSAKSRSNIPKQKLTYSHHSEKFKPLNTVKIGRAHV